MAGAFLIDHGERYEAESVQTLIEGIYFSRPENARKILRSRIYCDAEPTIAEKELIRVAAKRWGLASEAPPCEGAEPHAIAPPALSELPQFPEGAASEKLSPENAPTLLRSLLESIHRAPERFRSDRPVSAILLDREGKLLAYDVNTNATVKTRHAEMNLLLRRKLSSNAAAIPKGAVLIASLKPCAMCAARIWEEAEDPNDFQVHYLENDPGRLASNTMLMTESPARLRFLGRSHPLYSKPIQFQI